MIRYINRSEDTEQQAVVSWARMNSHAHKELELLHHIPNGGSRNKAEAVKLKRIGTKAGVSDLHLPVAKGIYTTLYIEMKYGDGKLSPAQKKFIYRRQAITTIAVHVTQLKRLSRSSENISAWQTAR